MANTAADILRVKGNCVHETCMESKAVVLSYFIDMDAVCSLTLQSDKHAIVSDQNISITIYHKGNGCVKMIRMMLYAKMGSTGARTPSEE